MIKSRVLALLMTGILIFTSLPFDVSAAGEYVDADNEQSVSDGEISVSEDQDILFSDDEDSEAESRDVPDEEELVEDEDQVDDDEYEDDMSPADYGLTEYSQPAANEAEIIRRMDEIKREFPSGSFFSVNRQACTNHSNADSCENCRCLPIVKAMGFSNPDVFTNDATCTAYAIFIYGYVFREKACSQNYKLPPDRCTPIAKGVTYNQLKSIVKPGDWIEVKESDPNKNQKYNHDMICYGWDNSSNKLLVFEANVGSTDKAHRTGHVNNGPNTSYGSTKRYYVYRNPTYHQNGCPTSNPPVINGAEISEINTVNGYYTVKATVTAEGGMDKVQFPTWTEYNGQDDLISDWIFSSRASGSITDLGNNQYLAQYTVRISDHNGERGTYHTHVYAYDKLGRTVGPWELSIDMSMEGNAPKILSAKVTEVNRKEGYYSIVATAHADAALDRIEFPTWTSYNGQDDLPASWPKGEVRSLGNNDYEAAYTVRISDHNNEKGWYNTHVYIFDCYGRYDSVAVNSINMDEYPTEPIKFDVNLAAKGKANVYNMMCEKWGGKIKISIFVSSDKKIAGVNSKGIVTGKKDGTVTITAYIKVGKEKLEAGSITVNVTKPVFKFTDIDLTYAGKSISARDHITNLPAGAQIKWSVPKSAQKIAAIDENTGVIVAGEKSGSVSVKCTISAYGYSCKYTAKLRVKLPKPIKSISIKDGKTKLVGINNVSKYTSVSWRSSSSALIIETTSKPYKIKVTADSVKDPSALTQPVILTAVIDGIEYKTNVVIK